MVIKMSQKTYHHGNLRNALIEAGIKLINEEGEKQFSLRKVAALCGVSQAAPYSHFESKEDLMKNMQEHVTEQFVKVLHRAAEDSRGQENEIPLAAIGKSYIMFFKENPEYFNFLFSQPCVTINLSLEDKEAANYAPFEIYKEVLLKVLKQTGVPKEQTEMMLIKGWALVHGLAAITTMKNVTYDKDWEKMIEAILSNG